MMFLVMLIVSIGIGIYAQKGRGRTGIVWTILAAILFIPIWLIFESVRLTDPALRSDENAVLAVHLAAGIIDAGIMSLIVWTLPHVLRAEDVYRAQMQGPGGQASSDPHPRS